jgi:hypothetical protein
MYTKRASEIEDSDAHKKIHFAGKIFFVDAGGAIVRPSTYADDTVRIPVYNADGRSKIVLDSDKIVGLYDRDEI